MGFIFTAIQVVRQLSTQRVNPWPGWQQVVIGIQTTHLGPFGSGHRGDLSKLIVDADESTKTSVVAPRLITNDLKGHALIVHAGGDTYSDTPALGGGGARVACGVVN